MPYIRRNAAAQIESLHRHPEDSAQEFLADNHPEVQTFVGRSTPNVTDLPAEAQAKLFARKSFRDRASRNSLNLFAPSGSDDVI
ncbi:MAG: hypothetical protein B7Y51_02915 [Burkholderiales bacterium 28-67-8]|nr:MAG: hypothetical protein B7Y51_02915 [Burkholderiales bacterium 28-67-8]